MLCASACEIESLMTWSAACRSGSVIVSLAIEGRAAAVYRNANSSTSQFSVARGSSRQSAVRSEWTRSDSCSRLRPWCA